MNFSVYCTFSLKYHTKNILPLRPPSLHYLQPSFTNNSLYMHTTASVPNPQPKNRTMELFGLLKFWRNRGPEVNQDSFDVSVTYPQCDISKIDIPNQTKLDAKAFNATVFSLSKMKTNFKSRSQLLVLRSSPKLRVSMLRHKKSSAEISCIMATPKREQSSSRNTKQKSGDSSSNKYVKLMKQASKIRIFDQSVSASPPAVFKGVCKGLMKSKSSVRTVPVPLRRRDDSALQQQDGIQSAILHCKRSYSSSSSSSSLSTISQECTVFSRCASECVMRRRNEVGDAI